MLHNWIILLYRNKRVFNVHTKSIVIMEELIFQDGFVFKKIIPYLHQILNFSFHRLWIIFDLEGETVLHRCRHHSINCNWLANVYSKFQSSEVPWEARKECRSLVGVVQILSQWLHCSRIPETQAQGQSMMLRTLLTMMGLASVQEPFSHRLQSGALCCAPSNSLMIALTMTCSWMSPATLHHSQRLNSSTIHGIRNGSAEIIPLRRGGFLLMEKKASPTSQPLVSVPRSLDTDCRIVLIDFSHFAMNS